MAIDVSVYRVSDKEFFSSPPPAPSAEFDAWFEDCRKKTLFYHPLEPTGTFWQYWYQPALSIGLTLISSVYAEGVMLAGDELDALSEEADRLERCWADMGLENAEPIKCVICHEDKTSEECLQPLTEHLRERLAALRRAIAIAKASDGLVSIG